MFAETKKRTNMKRIFLISIALLIGNFSIAQQSKIDSFYKDFKIYQEIIEHSHTGLNLYTSEEQFDSLYLETNKKLETTNTNLDFYKLLANVHTKINCGHSSVYYSFTEKEIDELIQSVFPSKIKFLGTKAFIEKSYCDIPEGSEMISINGNSIEDLIRLSFNLISSDGYNTTFKYRQLEQDFSQYLYLSYGKSRSFQVEYIDYSSKAILSKLVSPLNTDEIKEEQAEPEFDDIYNLSYIDGNTALLTVNSFHTPSRKLTRKYFKFLKKSFKSISEKGVENIIIDIRDNTGGNDGNDMELASYLINKPFKENKFRQLKTNEIISYPEYISSHLKEMFEMDPDTDNSKIVKMMNKEVEKEFGTCPAEDGFFYLKEENVIKCDPKKNLFQGNVYIMISGNVFSGGGLFSALVRDKSNAIFVGEETGGGYYRHTGSIPLIYELPYSKTVFSIFTVINEQDVNQQLFPQGSGTRPHYEVHQTPRQLINNEDAVLLKCIELIKIRNK